MTFTTYYDGALTKAKDTFPQTQAGVADIAHSAAGYNLDILPLSGSLVDRVFLTRQVDTINRAFRDSFNESKELQAEWSKYGLQLLLQFCNGPTVVGSSKPIKTLADIKGKKCRVAGSEGVALEIAGATPVGLPISDVYDALAKGVVDAFSACTVDLGVTYKLYEVAPYWSETGLGQTGMAQLAVNLNKWNKLPDDVKKVMLQVASEMIDVDAQRQLGEYRSALETGLKGGLQLLTFSDEDQKKFKEMAAPTVWGQFTKNDPVRQALLDRLVGLINKYAPQSKFMSAHELYEKEFKKK